MVALNYLRENMEKAVHEYLLAKAMDRSTLPKGYGKIEVSFRITCENQRPAILHNFESVEQTIKP